MVAEAKEIEFSIRVICCTKWERTDARLPADNTVAANFACRRGLDIVGLEACSDAEHDGGTELVRRVERAADDAGMLTR